MFMKMANYIVGRIADGIFMDFTITLVFIKKNKFNLSFSIAVIKFDLYENN